jgi:RHS repeat-associated protein
VALPNNGQTYRFGFNGKENDNGVKGLGNQQDYGMRIYDPRVGRFLSVDPLQAKFPFHSPYQFAGNTPIQAIDLDGAEEFHFLLSFDKEGKAHLTLVGQKDIKYAEWTPTWSDWAKKTIHINEEQHYYVHTGVFYEGTIENMGSVQFVNEEVVFSYPSTEDFNKGASSLTPADVQKRYSQLKWSTYAVKALNKVAEEARQGHIPGATRSKPTTASTGEQATRANNGNTKAAEVNTVRPEVSVGAMQRMEYEGAPYHGKTDNAIKSKAPVNGQSALDLSVQVKETSPRRVGVDYDTNEFVVFDRTQGNKYHGHVRSWSDLHPDMQKALIKSGMADKKGNIIKPNNE